MSAGARRRGTAVATSRRARPAQAAAGIRTAADRGELALRYQPEVDMRTGEIVAVEALVRWAHPNRGLLGPESFLAIAEQSDLMTVLGTWVIETALPEFASWAAGGPGLALRVNVSPSQLADSATLAVIAQTLQRTGLAPGRLCVEITESSAPDEARLAASVQALVDLGVRTALDDLAAGASTLSRLRALPVDIVKLDRSLITGLEDDLRAQAIVGAVMALSRTLALDVVAEGVETSAEAAALCELGCVRAQGHLFGRPVTGQEMSELLQTGGVTVAH